MDLRFDNVPFGRMQFAPTLWTKSVTVGAQSLRPPIDWDIIPTQVPKHCLSSDGEHNHPENGLYHPLLNIPHFVLQLTPI